MNDRVTTGDVELLFTEHWSRLLTSTAVDSRARSHKLGVFLDLDQSTILQQQH